MADFETTFAILVSRKIWVTKPFWNFHIVSYVIITVVFSCEFKSVQFGLKNIQDFFGGIFRENSDFTEEAKTFFCVTSRKPVLKMWNT